MKIGNPGKIIKKVLLVPLAWCEVGNCFKKWDSYMVLGKKLKVFIGTVGMMRGKKFIVFMVQLARSWVQLVRKVKIFWVIQLLCGYSSERS